MTKSPSRCPASTSKKRSPMLGRSELLRSDARHALGDGFAAPLSADHGEVELVTLHPYRQPPAGREPAQTVTEPYRGHPPQSWHSGSLVARRNRTSSPG